LNNLGKAAALRRTIYWSYRADTTNSSKWQRNNLSRVPAFKRQANLEEVDPKSDSMTTNPNSLLGSSWRPFCLGLVLGRSLVDVGRTKRPKVTCLSPFETKQITVPHKECFCCCLYRAPVLCWLRPLSFTAWNFLSAHRFLPQLGLPQVSSASEAEGLIG
jgi:hypothetical protein